MIWMENSIFAALVLDRVQYKYSGHMFRKYIVYADLGSYIIPLSFLSFNKTEIEF